MVNHTTMTQVRLDKWLWAARFFKTRSLAKHAIEGGKVYYEGQRVKVSKMVSIGAELRVRQGYDDKTIVIEALSEQRGNATMAATLYRETDASIALREQRKLERQQGHSHISHERPNKRERRQIHALKQQHYQD